MNVEKPFAKYDDFGAIKSLTVIGNGMLAKGFFRYEGLDLPVCLFTSGISDSNCTHDSEFQRESNLLDEVCANLPSKVILVYFSSSSEEVSFKQQKYFFHKRQMEAKVRKRSKHLIIRLGQIIGHSSNPSTLTNFLFTRIAKGESFQMWRGQSRNLLDLDDVVEATINHLKIDEFLSATIVLANPVNYNVEEIIQAFENLLGRSALATHVETPLIKINLREETLLNCIFPPVDVDGYLNRVLAKYYA